MDNSKTNNEVAYSAVAPHDPPLDAALAAMRVEITHLQQTEERLKLLEEEIGALNKAIRALTDRLAGKDVDEYSIMECFLRLMLLEDWQNWRDPEYIKAHLEGEKHEPDKEQPL